MKKWKQSLSKSFVETSHPSIFIYQTPCCLNCQNKFSIGSFNVIVFFLNSDIGERLCMDFSGNKCRTLLRNLSSSEVETVANFETCL